MKSTAFSIRSDFPLAFWALYGFNFRAKWPGLTPRIATILTVLGSWSRESNLLTRSRISVRVIRGYLRQRALPRADDRRICTYPLALEPRAFHERFACASQVRSGEFRSNNQSLTAILHGHSKYLRLDAGV